MPKHIEFKVNAICRKLKEGGVDECIGFGERQSIGHAYIVEYLVDSLHVILFVHIVQEPVRLSLSPDSLLRYLRQQP